MKITDEMVEAGAQALQEYNAPNTKLRPHGDIFADAKRKLVRLVLEAALKGASDEA